jgi:hypothetical protein
MSILYRVRQPVEEEQCRGTSWRRVTGSTPSSTRVWIRSPAASDVDGTPPAATALRPNGWRSYWQARRRPTNEASVSALGRYLLETWLPAKRVNLRPSTWNGYHSIVELHVVPRVGRVPLRRLRAQHLESLYADLLANDRRDGKGGLDPKTVLEVHVILHKALRDACRRGLVVRNIASDAEAPKRRRPTDDLRAWNCAAAAGISPRRTS